MARMDEGNRSESNCSCLAELVAMVIERSGKMCGIFSETDDFRWFKHVYGVVGMGDHHREKEILRSVRLLRWGK